MRWNSTQQRGMNLLREPREVGARPGSDGGWRWLDLGLALVVSAIAAAIRWPYLILIPRMTDEWEDAQFALGLFGDPAQLVSNDAYNGPLFHWLLAGLLAFTRSPLGPRLLVLVLGALTVGLTYALATSLSAWQRGRREAVVQTRSSGERDLENDADRVRSDAQTEAEVLYAAAPQGSLLALVPSLDRADRIAGLLAAALMAVAFIPVVVNSHIAWSNSTTPFWTTLLLLVLVEAVRRDRPRWLLAAGLLAGLAQQTHPSVLAILVGAALWTVGVRPRWLRGRWPWLAGLIALVTVGNLLLYNLQSQGGSVEMAEVRDYAYTGGAGWEEYRDNLGRTSRLGYQMVGSAFLAELNEESDPEALREILLAPATLLYGALALAALVWGLTGGAWLPAACWLAAILLLPFFNRGWHHFIFARYLAGLLPPTFAAMGILLVRVAGLGEGTASTSSAADGADHGRVRGAAGADRAGGEAGAERAVAAAGRVRELFGAVRVMPGMRPARSIATLTITALLLTIPLLRLQRFYARELDLGRHNRRVLQTLRMLEEVSAEGHPVALDRELRFLRLTAGGNLLNVLDGMLDLRGVPHALVDAEDQADLAGGSFIVLSHAQKDALDGRIDLEATEPEPFFAPAAPGDYNLYRVLDGTSIEEVPDP
jgi:hypothetical protein